MAPRPRRSRAADAPSSRRPVITTAPIGRAARDMWSVRWSVCPAPIGLGPPSRQMVPGLARPKVPSWQLGKPHAKPRATHTGAPPLAQTSHHDPEGGVRGAGLRLRLYISAGKRLSVCLSLALLPSSTRPILRAVLACPRRIVASTNALALCRPACLSITLPRPPPSHPDEFELVDPLLAVLSALPCFPKPVDIFCGHLLKVSRLASQLVSWRRPPPRQLRT